MSPLNPDAFSRISLLKPLAMAMEIIIIAMLIPTEVVAIMLLSLVSLPLEVVCCPNLPAIKRLRFIKIALFFLYS
jgi:hypothetical protein